MWDKTIILDEHEMARACTYWKRSRPCFYYGMFPLKPKKKKEKKKNKLFNIKRLYVEKSNRWIEPKKEKHFSEGF